MAKHTQKIRQLLTTNCFSVFDHFAGLHLKLLTIFAKRSIANAWQYPKYLSDIP